MSRAFPIGTQVRFRPDFGAVGASGLVFTVDTAVSKTPEGRELVGLKIRKENGRTAHRNAWTADLIEVQA